MKRLDELGVSPAPWTAHVDEDFDSIDEVRAVNNELIVCDAPHADARLIAAAPDLYEALREAAEKRCGWCAWNDGSEATICAKCDVPRWRKALEKAGGGE